MTTLPRAPKPSGKHSGEKRAGGFSRPRRFIASAILSLSVLSLFVTSEAGAATYQPTNTLTHESMLLPVGVAVDQSTGDVYVGQVLRWDVAENSIREGTILKFGPSGSFVSTFPDEESHYMGIGINSSTHTLYATAGSTLNTSEIKAYNSSGVLLGSPIPVTSSPGTSPQPAVDASGDIYYPSASTDTVEKLDPTSGTPEVPVQTITCSSCPSPASFSDPTGVAVDSGGNIYVVDSGNGRIVKFDSEGDSGATPVVLFSGTPGTSDSPEAIAVNEATDDLFVGYGGGETFHVVGYHSDGSQFAEFGEGLFNTEIFANLNRIAVDSGSGAVYVSDGSVNHGNSKVWVFSPVAPTAATTAPSSIAQTQATLNGTVNPNEGGAITDCHFDWGTTTEYTGGSVPCSENPADGSSAVPVKGTLSGLSANSTYHYRLVVDNGTGPVKGGDQTLKTLPLAAIATTEAATGIGQNAAVLHATVNAKGGEAACVFQYGTTAAYGASVPCSINPVTGSVDTAVSASLGGLSAGAVYHFRVVATNGAGPTNGLDQTFGTQSAPAPPSPTPPAPTPSVTTSPPAKKPLKCKKGFKKKTVKGKAKCVKVKKKKGKKH